MSRMALVHIVQQLGTLIYLCLPELRKIYPFKSLRIGLTLIPRSRLLSQTRYHCSEKAGINFTLYLA
jgi:hypothetical protein